MSATRWESAESPVVLSLCESLLIHELETPYVGKWEEDEAGAGAYGKTQVNPYLLYTPSCRPGSYEEEG